MMIQFTVKSVRATQGDVLVCRDAYGREIVTQIVTIHGEDGFTYRWATAQCVSVGDTVRAKEIGRKDNFVLVTRGRIIGRSL